MKISHKRVIYGASLVIKARASCLFLPIIVVVVVIVAGTVAVLVLPSINVVICFSIRWVHAALDPQLVVEEYSLYVRVSPLQHSKHPDTKVGESHHVCHNFVVGNLNDRRARNAVGPWLKPNKNARKDGSHSELPLDEFI